MSPWSGIKVVAQECLPEFTEKHRKERKWARRVMHQRYRRFDITYTRYVMVLEGVICAHPNTVAILANEVPNGSVR